MDINHNCWQRDNITIDLFFVKYSWKIVGYNLHSDMEITMKTWTISLSKSCYENNLEV